jgi:serine O-acetyltransferase
VVDALAGANTDLIPTRRLALGHHALPSREALEVVVADLQATLFPAHFGAGDVSPAGIRQFVGHRLDAALAPLQEQIWRGLVLSCTHGDDDCAQCEGRAAELTHEFALRLPDVRTRLGSDVRAAYEGDPAATSPDEAVFCYPGITAITHQRLAHELYLLGVPLIPRIITELAHSATGIDIHPGARIGGSFFIDHGTGVVIGETCIIGERVRLYQGVTLGAKSFPTDERGKPIKGRPRHPIVEDDVTIYAGATILGRITVGRGSSIGGNVWITRDVPPGSFIRQGPARVDPFEAGSGIGTMARREASRAHLPSSTERLLLARSATRHPASQPAGAACHAGALERSPDRFRRRRVSS